MDQLSLQDLVDYLHTAVSENDLLFVHYWLKELEQRGGKGKQAIQTGKHSWKNETAIEAIWQSEEEVNETSRIIYEILRLLGVRMIEEVETMKDGEQMKERWERLKAGIEAQAQAALLLSMEEESAAKWIDECGFAPPPGKVLTGWNSLPKPPPHMSPPSISSSPINNTQLINDQSTDDTSKSDRLTQSPSINHSFSHSSIPPSSQSSNTTLSSSSTSTSSSVSSHKSQPVPLDSTLLDSDPTPLVRFHSFRWIVGEALLGRIEQDVNLPERPISYHLYRGNSNAVGNEDGFILVRFSSKMNARLAVEYFRTKFPRHIRIEVETDYRDRQPLSSNRSSLSPVTWRNYAAQPDSSHPWLKRKSEPLQATAELGEIHDDNPPLLKVASMSGKLPARPDVCPSVKQEDPRFPRSFKKSQEHEGFNVKRFGSGRNLPLSSGSKQEKLGGRYVEKGDYQRKELQKGDYKREEVKKGDYRGNGEGKKGDYRRPSRVDEIERSLGSQKRY
ncbi:hypothetical protein JCM5353_007345 [Sporobolomyces roseus]